MALEQASIVVVMAIWGICNLFVLFVLLSAAIQRRTIDLIRGGLFLKVLAMTIAVNSSAYSTFYGIPPVLSTDPTIVLIVASMGAVGVMMICWGLMR